MVRVVQFKGMGWMHNLNILKETKDSKTKRINVEFDRDEFLAAMSHISQMQQQFPPGYEAYVCVCEEDDEN